MTVINPSYEILTSINSKDILKRIERYGRTCYKSECKITDGSAVKFISMLLKRGHESVIEHESLTIKFICDRGVSHELVRHRLASYSQESTRYCNYAKKGALVFIRPFFFTDKGDLGRYGIWFNAITFAESSYLRLIELRATPQEARSVLPNSLKTEIVVTANLREWRHILKLRCDKAAHPQMRQLMCPLLNQLKSSIAVIFDDIKGE